MIGPACTATATVLSASVVLDADPSGVYSDGVASTDEISDNYFTANGYPITIGSNFSGRFTTISSPANSFYIGIYITKQRSYHRQHGARHGGIFE